MFATFVIVFREVLEAGLIVGIVLAASRGLASRGLWVAGGIGAGVVGAAILAAFAGTISNAVAGMGQEMLNAAILFLAVGMLGWHNVWMSRHGHELAMRMNAVGRAVLNGQRPMYALAAVVALAVLREGAEVVLFLYGIGVASSEGASLMFAGGVIGILAGAAVSLALYLGLLRVPTRHLFAVTGWMITLLAAGMAAQGAGYLIQAGVFPPLGRSLWDTSWLLSDSSVIGQLLHTLVGYIDRPAGLQVAFYVLTLGILVTLMRRFAQDQG